MTAAGNALPFPSGRKYQEALQNTTVCFTHHELKGARPEVTKLGLPRPISGQFASVFSLTSPSGRRFAVKCFTTEVRDQQDRYEAISSHLSGIATDELSQPWRIGFEYLPHGILVDGRWYPVLKMDWVEAISLSNWLDTHYTDPLSVRRLADRFAALADDLATHDVAHGDLQHGNLLVAPDHTFRLVDYDGMYVPALAGRHSTELGHRNFQSPARGSDDFDAALDNFSNWVIYLSLTAIATDHTLWPRLHEQDGEYLLLAEDDFRQPAASARFPALLGHGDKLVRGLAEQVQSLAWQPLSLVPPLAVEARSADPSAAAAPAAAPPSSSGSASRPSWLDSHLPPSTGPAQAVPAPARFAVRRFTDVLAAALLTLSVLVPGLLAFASLLVPLLTAASYAGALSLSMFTVRAARLSRPEVMDARRHMAELNARRGQLRIPAKEVEQLEQERRNFEDVERRRKDQHSAAEKKLNRAFAKSVDKAEKERLRDQSEADRHLTSLDGGMRAALQQTLQVYRQEFIADELRRTRIREQELTGFGRGLVQQLAMKGIRTAADFSGIKLIAQGGRFSTRALIVTASGRQVDVVGVGEKRARTLDAWRQNHYSAASRRAPSQLPAARAQAIRADFDRQRTELHRRRAQAAHTALLARDHAKHQLEAGLGRVAAERGQADHNAHQQRWAFAARAQSFGNPHAQLAAVELELAAAKQASRVLSTARYLRFGLTGH
ncbi:MULTISPECIES: hypothetical protein [unclassified Streptomyces]|uniref:hypothetical protein n=1 Tax=unclassified Streptomyces TaxID=2593676 RepID=UPI0037F4154A